MGKSTSVDELVRKFDKLGQAVRRDGKETVGAIAQFHKTTALGLAAKEVGGDLRFRNNRRRPLRVNYDIVDAADGAKAEVRAGGPFSWLEYGVAPHPIIPGARNKRFRGLTGIGLKGAAGPVLGVESLIGTSAIRGRGKGKVLAFANGMFRRYALQAGGYPEKGTWSESVERTTATAGEIADRQFIRTIGDVIR